MISNFDFHNLKKKYRLKVSMYYYIQTFDIEMISIEY